MGIVLQCVCVCVCVFVCVIVNNDFTGTFRTKLHVRIYITYHNIIPVGASCRPWVTENPKHVSPETFLDLITF